MCTHTHIYRWLMVYTVGWGFVCLSCSFWRCFRWVVTISSLEIMIRMMVLIWITSYMYIMNHIKKHEKTSYTRLYGYMVSEMGCSGRVLRVFLVRYDGRTCKNIAQDGRITLYMTSTMSLEKKFFWLYHHDTCVHGVPRWCHVYLWGHVQRNAGRFMSRRQPKKCSGHLV